MKRISKWLIWKWNKWPLIGYWSLEIVALSMIIALILFLWCILMLFFLWFFNSLFSRLKLDNVDSFSFYLFLFSSFITTLLSIKFPLQKNNWGFKITDAVWVKMKWRILYSWHFTLYVELRKTIVENIKRYKINYSKSEQIEKIDNIIKNYLKDNFL